MRERFFTPRLRFASYEEMNAWLLDRCLEHARAHRHPELRERTVAEMFEDEKPALLRLPIAPFDGFHALTATVSKTLLVRFDYNKYLVAARAPGRRSRSMPSPVPSAAAGGVEGPAASSPARAATSSPSMIAVRAAPAACRAPVTARSPRPRPRTPPMDYRDNPPPPKVDYVQVWRFAHAEGLSFKKSVLVVVGPICTNPEPLYVC